MHSRAPDHAVISKTVQRDWGRIISIIYRQTGDLSLAEDSVQDALEAALKHWHRNGLPNHPDAWIIKTAGRKALDRLRRSKTVKDKSALIHALVDADRQIFSPENLDAIPDKRLELMFTCCHPALSKKSRIALTLRTILGLSVDNIAQAFLDTPSAMAQRLSRARNKIKTAGIPYSVPDRTQFTSRLHLILTTIYLIFNQAYTYGDDGNLNQEALRLIAIIQELCPNEAEVHGLHALLLFTKSRRHARYGNRGEFIPLESQDRTLWQKPLIEQANALLVKALKTGNIGPFQLQAAIHGVHCRAQDWKQTDWSEIAQLYNLLFNIQPTTVIAVNRAMALSYSLSVQAGLEAIERLKSSSDIEAYAPYFLVKADMHERLGQMKLAIAALNKAISLTSQKAERDFLIEKQSRIMSYLSVS